MKSKLLTLPALVISTVKILTTREKPAANPAVLAKKLAPPSASLISLPFQNNTGYGIGAFKGSGHTLDFQPAKNEGHLLQWLSS